MSDNVLNMLRKMVIVIILIHATVIVSFSGLCSNSEPGKV